ncbi:hypothetical protein DFH07DRAFT_773734 [Mycena maculata]|uniref:Uncharacterized protein n=1 Tax=Mycena maculata TaxID=230809 RepID=A0AAD7NBZ5_9AGAR|nr:hypothetical protein DFH07DRAFT_773734 [Mycena maculata]
MRLAGMKPALSSSSLHLRSSCINLRRRGRHKGRVTSAATSSGSVAEYPTPFLALTSDTIRTSLDLLNKSADACPLLKSAGVLAVWDLVNASNLCSLPICNEGLIDPGQHVSASDENAQVLAWHAVGILDAIYNVVEEGTRCIPPGMFPETLKFEALLLKIRAAMEAQLKPGWACHVLRLRRHESGLARFTSRPDAASEAFKIGASTRVELAVDTIQGSSTRVESVVDKIQRSSTRVELAVHKNPSGRLVHRGAHGYTRSIECKSRAHCIFIIWI